MIMPIHAAGGLCGICSDGRRVLVTDIDKHKVHVLRLSNERRSVATAARDAQEAAMREELYARQNGPSGARGSSGGSGSVSRSGVPASDRGRTAGRGGESVSHGGAASAADEAEAQERKIKETQRDLALHRALSAPHSAKLPRVLGLPANASKEDVMQGVRLALRLLHPDRSMNIALRDTLKGRQLEAAFKRVNNLKDDL